MGYDVTFHPFSRAEFDFYVRRVVEDPTNYLQQIAHLHDSQEEHDFLDSGIYAHTAASVEKLRVGTQDFEKGIGFSAAAVFGYLHPYWYSRGGMLSRLDISPFDNYRGDISDLVTGPSKWVFDKAYGVIMENYSSGVYVPYEKIGHLKNLLQDPANETLVNEVIGDSNLPSLLHCLDYCLKHQLDLLEATDLYVPMSGSCSSLTANFRASYMKNIDNHVNSGRSKPIS